MREVLSAVRELVSVSAIRKVVSVSVSARTGQDGPRTNGSCVWQDRAYDRFKDKFLSPGVCVGATSSLSCLCVG
jgi:hypothetical protein